MIIKRPKKGLKLKIKKAVNKKVKKAKVPKKVLVKKNHLSKLSKIKLKKTIKKQKITLFRAKLRMGKEKIIKKSVKNTINSKKKIYKKTRIIVRKKNNFLTSETKKIRVIKSVKHKIIKKENISIFPIENLFKAKIKVVGIGGGGGSIVSEIGRSLNKATFVIADTDIRALKKKAGIKYFWFGEKFTHGLGTGVNPEIAKIAAESEKGRITDLFKDQDIVILIASLGGGLGSGATKVFAEAAKSFGGITLGIFTLPFKFEGKNKSKIAQKALKELKSSLNVSITIPNERIFKIIDTNTSITNAFSTVNKNLIESLESLIDLIYNPGLINIDFADFRTILSGNGNSAFLNTVHAFGKNKVKETIEKILVNPLYQNNNFIAEKILFNISGGINLNMFEVEKISKSIAELNPKAKIIFGISKDIKAKNKIKTTILITGPSKIVEPIKEVIKINTEVIVKKRQKVKKAKVTQKLSKNILPDGNLVPIFNKDHIAVETFNKLSITEPANIKNKKNIRRNALEIQKAEALEQDKRLLQEEEWEVPAFLRRVKFKS
ncbi:MAG: cell division protein FtsZ [Patescibacteria group bacterium]